MYVPIVTGMDAADRKTSHGKRRGREETKRYSFLSGWKLSKNVRPQLSILCFSKLYRAVRNFRGIFFDRERRCIEYCKRVSEKKH